MPRKTWDAVLLELIEDLETVEVEGSHQAKVWIGTGLRIAINEIKAHRIELLVTGERPK